MKHEARKLSASYVMSSKLLNKVRTDVGAKRMVCIELAKMIAMTLLDDGYADIKEETIGSETAMKMDVVVLVKTGCKEEGGQ